MLTLSSTLKRCLVGSFAIISLTAVAFAGNASRPTLPEPATNISTSTVKGTQTAVLAGGCFWGVEAVFEHLKGVSDVVSGYSGGSAATAHYKTIGSGDTGHAESVKITYDPSQISYSQLLKVYFSVAHDPTQLNRQGPDWGTQYRSAIFFNNDEQKRVAPDDLATDYLLPGTPTVVGVRDGELGDRDARVVEVRWDDGGVVTTAELTLVAENGPRVCGVSR